MSLSASALFSFPETSSLMRPCSACSTAILAIRSAISCSFTLSLSQNWSCVVKSSSLTLRTPLFASSPAPFRDSCPSYRACVFRKRSCRRAVINAPCCSMRSSRAASWAATDCECSCSAEWEAEMRESWWASLRARMVKFLERDVWTTQTMLTSYSCYSYTVTSLIRIIQQNSSLGVQTWPFTDRLLSSFATFPTHSAPLWSSGGGCNNFITILQMEKLKETFQRAWRGVIAPSRYQYNINTVCPREQLVEGRLIERLDFTVPRDDGSNISAVILREKHRAVKDALLYFHGNGGSKIEILGVLPLIAEHGVAVISFDFVGCGNSDAGFLTYGLNQSADAETVLRQAYKYLQVERLTVWGRSMGAVTAILFAAKNHKIVDKLVLDSPFKSLEEVVRRVINRQTSLPQPLVSLLLYFLKKEIETRLALPLFAQDYMAHFKRIPRTVGVLLICSDNDSIVPKQEVEEFYRAFRGERELMEIEEGHEEDRGTKVYAEVLRWVKKEKGRKNMKLRLFRPEECYECEKEQVYTIC